MVFCIFFCFIFALIGAAYFDDHNIKEKDQQVVIALSQKPSTLDPRFATDAVGMRIGNLIFHSLVRLDRNLKVVSSLAQKWSCSKKVCSFHIPKGVTFSNSSPLTAEDIQFSFDQYRLKKSPFYSAFQSIKKVDVQENKKELIVTIYLKYFSATFLSADLPVLRILSKKEALEGRLVGSGPFVLIAEDSNQIHLRARENSMIKNIIFKVIRDDLTRFQKVLRGELDIVQSELPFSSIEKIKKLQKDYHVFQRAGLSMNYLLINMQDPTFRDLEVRRALAFAIDRESIIQHKLKGFARKAESILNDENSFFSKNLTYNYNLKKAQSILEKQGLKQKKIQLKTSSNQEVVSYAKVIAEGFRKAGFQVELKSYEWGTFYGDLKKGQFQLALLRWVGVFDPDIYRLAFHSLEVPPQGRNRGFYKNKQLDTLLTAGQKEFDLQERKQIYKKVQQIVSSDLPIIPLWHNQQTAVVKKDIQGYFLPANGSYDFLLSISRK
ncbi:MAG: ABC transporter substrate-binding protein [Bdellovibrionales bacterium]|nr:ABC transporter substrate-binding protein [Bdellovibrionales bacterium]